MIIIIMLFESNDEYILEKKKTILIRASLPFVRISKIHKKENNNNPQQHEYLEIYAIF